MSSKAAAVSFLSGLSVGEAAKDKDKDSSKPNKPARGGNRGGGGKKRKGSGKNAAAATSSSAAAAAAIGSGGGSKRASTDAKQAKMPSARDNRSVDGVTGSKKGKKKGGQGRMGRSKQLKRRTKKDGAHGSSGTHSTDSHGSGVGHSQKASSFLLGLSTDRDAADTASSASTTSHHRLSHSQSASSIDPRRDHQPPSASNSASASASAGDTAPSTQHGLGSAESSAALQPRTPTSSANKPAPLGHAHSVDVLAIEDSFGNSRPGTPTMSSSSAAKVISFHAPLEQTDYENPHIVRQVRQSRTVLTASFTGPPVAMFSVIPYRKQADSTNMRYVVDMHGRPHLVTDNELPWLDRANEISYRDLLRPDDNRFEVAADHGPGAKGTGTGGDAGGASNIIQYNPFFLDDPEMVTGNKRTVMNLDGWFVSIVPYVTPDDLKAELNEQFSLKHPWVHPDITLSRLRHEKKVLLDVVVQYDIDLTTLAIAFVYLEKMIYRGVINSVNFELIAATCLTLALKFCDLKALDPKFVYSVLESLGNVTPKQVFRSEWAVFTQLRFTLHIPSREYLPHLKRVLRALDMGGVQEYLRGCVDLDRDEN